MKHFALLLAVATLFIAGCNNVPSAHAPLKEFVFDRYYTIELEKDDSTTVMKKLECRCLCEEEYLSQSESAIAKWAQRGTYNSFWVQRGDYAVVWFNLVGFEEESLTAKRKYALLFDEDSPGWLTLIKAPSKTMRLDIDMIMDDGTLEEPYATAADKWIAIIEKSRKNYLNDACDIRTDSHAVDSVSMLINQTFFQILEQVRRTPALTQRLDQCRGMEFDHTVLDEGNIVISIDEDRKLVKVKLKIGSYVKNSEKHQDIKCIDCKETPCPKSACGKSAACGPCGTGCKKYRPKKGHFYKGSKPYKRVDPAADGTLCDPCKDSDSIEEPCQDCP